MDSNPRKFTLYVDAVGVELNNAAAGGADKVEIVFRGNVTPGDRKRLQKAIVEEAVATGTLSIGVKRLL